ncbi:MAG: SGNH/GDSL hydrolase family protein, partial [Candidatus Omnitrophica bacterium]|nr:SGNH/GDSL hydrolase family protein [Candidatus Omnitrophota bacterium]
MSLIVLFLVLGGLELFFRTTHFLGARISWSTPDPILGWRFTPSQKFWTFEENDHPIVWTTNRFGWKDKEWSQIKPEDIYRIAVLGDSYVEAVHVEPDKNFLALAEKKLNSQTSHSAKFEVMNFGRSAFTQTEEWLVLQSEITSFRPDAVVLFFFPVNDISDMSPETTLDPLRPYFNLYADGSLELDTSFQNSWEFKLKSILTPFKHHSAFISFLTERYTILRASRLIKQHSSSESSAALPGYLSLATQHPTPAYEKNYQLNKLVIQKMAAWCRE